MRGKLFIGTSGWHYKHWLGLFYPKNLPPREMLEFYAQHFDTVEINNSFYRLPAAATFEAWKQNSPPRFLFAVKGSRFTTHMKKLKDPVSSTEKFFDAVDHLGKKLGPILFQLPPRWRVNTQRLAEFLESIPGGRRYVFEFRDESWYSSEVYELLRKHRASMCIHDLGGKQTPIEVTSDFTYIRFHGPGEAKYAGSYSSAAMKKWAERIKEWQQELSGVYVYFNNDIGGHAIENAKELKRLVE
jgi:uncharacterized protein YecE (DUF72 family)